ncbi:hypothetical protein OCV51_02735 [Faecalicatena acetigenes]|uniref:Uncharacterized protein n=1 Tax=Faecalicatena acetigenes TaxID=2981790 RepID=A0ABT2T8J2_9FIRM|nr:MULTISPECIES: hypothetical protein [Lachnospiraceae]MCU6746583.1 hypothetical protein [Faecalicatena acetigenes]SCH30519.1 Uncharacterised protein [uncultured Clostridium sp.]
MKYTQGQKAYSVESNRFIKEVTIVRGATNSYVVWFTDTGGVIQVHDSRVFATEEKASAFIPSEKNKIRSSYEH